MSSNNNNPTNFQESFGGNTLAKTLSRHSSTYFPLTRHYQINSKTEPSSQIPPEEPLAPPFPLSSTVESKKNQNMAEIGIEISDDLKVLKERSPDLVHILFPIHNKLHLAQSKISKLTMDGSWGWTDSFWVKLPISKNYTKLRKEEGKSVSVTKWEIIQEELTKLKSIFDCNKNVHRIGNMIQETVGSYNSQFKAENFLKEFNILNNPTLRNELIETLPIIVDFALQLNKRLGAPIPILKADRQTIYMDQYLACSLLANAFFCTFPDRPNGIPGINFYNLYCGESENVKLEKLKCILNYFKKMKFRNPKDNYLISFERRAHTGWINWENSKNELSKVTVESNGKIENQENMLQVDFANKYIGGGILGEGMVQEEIRFTICPELIISRLFTEVLKDNEVLVITGCEQFSKYSGYKSTFKFEGSHYDTAQTDRFGRKRTQVVAMDALHFRESEKSNQYKKNFVDRELLKCFTAFQIRNPTGYTKPIATGNWGCGAFNGNPELKFLIQLLSASQANSRPLHFFTFGDTRQKESFEIIVKFLQEKKFNVGLLYKSICKYEKEINAFTYSEHSVFKFVENYAKNKKTSF